MVQGEVTLWTERFLSAVAGHSAAPAEPTPQKTTVRAARGRPAGASPAAIRIEPFSPVLGHYSKAD